MNQRIEEELFPFYALDALTDEEKAEVEAYIASNPAAQERLATFQQTADLIPLTTEAITPSSSVKVNLMARVQADSRVRARQTAVPQSPRSVPAAKQPFAPQPTWWERLRQSFAMPALAGAAALAAIILFVWALSLNQQIDQLQNQVADLQSDAEGLQADLETLQADNEQLRVRNDALQQQIENQNDILASYQQPGTNTIAIGDISGEYPQAHATLTVDHNADTATFVAENLPMLDSARTYQLWIIRGDQPMSAAIFNVDENGRIVHQLQGGVAAAFDAVGISIEPAGGSEQPTPDQIILLGATSS